MLSSEYCAWVGGSPSPAPWIHFQPCSLGRFAGHSDLTLFRSMARPLTIDLIVNIIGPQCIVWAKSSDSVSFLLNLPISNYQSSVTLAIHIPTNACSLQCQTVSIPIRDLHIISDTELHILLKCSLRTSSLKCISPHSILLSWLFVNPLGADACLAISTDEYRERRKCSVN